LFSRDEIKWTRYFQSYQNDALNNILEEFQKLLQNEKSFDQVRDHIREALQAEDYNSFRVGRFANILTLWNHILNTPQAVQKVYQQCKNGHIRNKQFNNSGASSIGINPNGYTIMSQCFMPEPELSPRICRQCSENLFIHHELVSAKPLLALEFAEHEIQIENQILVKIENLDYNYKLIGIIYFGSEHFTARIILEDGQIWFHDGITTSHNTIYDGSLTLNRPELYTCRGKRASLVLYSLD
jgi:hypothetical protein